MTDRKISAIIDEVWGRYDTDHSGYLEMNEVEKMLRDIFTQSDKNISNEQMKIILSILDENGDGRIGKDELKDLLRS